MSVWDGQPVIGHGGGTIGQTSFLMAIPGRELVVALLTNSEHGDLLWENLARWLFAELADTRMPGVPPAADPPPDLPLTDYAGSYERLGVRSEIAAEEGQLIVRRHVTGPMAQMRPEPEPPLRLRPVTRDTFVASGDGSDRLVSFLEFGNDGRPGYFWAGRAARRTGG
jgi:hypothetical protein